MKLGRFSRWFELTSDEQFWAIAITAIFLVGLIARYVHLRTADPMPQEPAQIEEGNRE